MSDTLLSNRSVKTTRFVDLQRKWQEQQRKTTYELKLAQAFSVADMYLTQRYLDHFSAGMVMPPDAEILNPLKLRIFRITKLVFDPQEPINDKFISVYSSLHNLNSAVALIIQSDGINISFFVATRADDSVELVGETLRSVLQGNFPGIDISESLNGDEKRELLSTFSSDSRVPKSLVSVSLIPSERDEDKHEFIQGIRSQTERADRLAIRIRCR